MQEGAASIGRVVVDMIATRSADGLVAVGTHGQGVFSGNSPAIGPPPAPSGGETALGRPYPNPVGGPGNPFVTFAYTLRETARVRLSIYDLTGREVARLVDEPREAGLQPDAYWYPGGAASGVYICSLVAGSATEAVKFVVLR